MEKIGLTATVKYTVDKYDENNCLIETIEREEEMTEEKLKELFGSMEG